MSNITISKDRDLIFELIGRGNTASAAARVLGRSAESVRQYIYRTGTSVHGIRAAYQAASEAVQAVVQEPESVAMEDSIPMVAEPGITLSAAPGGMLEVPITLRISTELISQRQPA